MNWNKVKQRFLEETFYGSNKGLTSLTKEQTKEVISFFRTHVNVECSSVTWKMPDEKEKKIIQEFIRKFFEE